MFPKNVQFMEGKPNIRTIPSGLFKNFKGILGIITRLLFQIQEMKWVYRGLREASVFAVHPSTWAKTELC